MKRSRYVNKNKMTRFIWKIVDKHYYGIYSALAKDIGISKQGLCYILTKRKDLTERIAQKLKDLFPDLDFSSFEKKDNKKLDNVKQ